MSASHRDLMGVAAFAREIKRVRGREMIHANPRATSGPVRLRCRKCRRVVSGAPWRAIVDDKRRLACTCQVRKTGPKTGGRADVQQKLDDKYGTNEYVLLDERTHKGQRLRFRHSCGQEFTTYPGSLLRDLRSGARCPCTYRKERVTRELHERELARVHGGAYRLVAWGGHNNEPSTYRHDRCGRLLRTRRNKIIAYDFCPHCHGKGGSVKNRSSIEDVQWRVDAVNPPGEYVVTSLERRVSPRGKNGFRYRVRHDCGHEFNGNRELCERGRLGRCPACYGSNRCSRDVQYGGKWFRVRGFEELTLQRLLRRYKAGDILMRLDEGFPVIWYSHRRKRSAYFTDFYIQSTDTAIEVKSLATAGLVKDNNYLFNGGWSRLQAKARQCIKRGCRFVLHLYVRAPGGLRLATIPDDWLDLTKRQMVRRLGLRLQ